MGKDSGVSPSLLASLPLSLPPSLAPSLLSQFLPTHTRPNRLSRLLISAMYSCIHLKVLSVLKPGLLVIAGGQKLFCFFWLSVPGNHQL